MTICFMKKIQKNTHDSTMLGIISQYLLVREDAKEDELRAKPINQIPNTK